MYLRSAVVKRIIIAALAVLLLGAFIYKSHTALYIHGDEALKIALADAGLHESQIYDTSVEFERHRGEAWYEVDFDSSQGYYSYTLDARSGKILSDIY